VDRRAFVSTVALGLLAAPLVSEGQQQTGRVYRIGFLQPVPQTVAIDRMLEAFRQGLRDHGYVEGQNIVIEHRMSNTPKDHPALLADLVGQKMDVIVTWTTPALVAAKKATRTIPIVGMSGDPVQTGLAASLARPGGNLTGLAIFTDDLELKKLQLLKETVPGVTRVGVLWNPDNPVWTHTLRRLQEAAPTLSVKLQPLTVRASGDLDAAFAAATREKAGALLVVNDATLTAHQQRIVDFAATHRLPAMHDGRTFVEDGGLMAYSVDFNDMLRRTAGYVHKILKGANPRGPSHRAAHQVRPGREHAHRHDTRPYHPAVDPGAGGSGHRMMERPTLLRGLVLLGVIVAPFVAGAQRAEERSRVGLWPGSSVTAVRGLQSA
jgi:putative tryptophan/tyrosine transport system substrate-binding protein